MESLYSSSGRTIRRQKRPLSNIFSSTNVTSTYIAPIDDISQPLQQPIDTHLCSDRSTTTDERSAIIQTTNDPIVNDHLNDDDVNNENLSLDEIDSFNKYNSDILVMRTVVVYFLI